LRGVRLTTGRSRAELDLLAKVLFQTEKYFLRDGLSEFVYDKELDVFRFPEDGRVAFCDEFADWGLLEERGYLDS
jgi:hypothetical protein